MEQARPRLPAHEWAAVITFLIILAFIAIMNLVVNKRDYELVLPKNQTNTIFITLEGAVSETKTFQVEKGAKLNEVLQKVGVLVDADLSSFKLSQPLKKDQIIVIPAKKTMTIFLEGDVTPRGPYTIEVNSSLKDLYQKLGKKPPLKDRKLEDEEVLKF